MQPFRTVDEAWAALQAQRDDAGKVAGHVVPNPDRFRALLERLAATNGNRPVPPSGETA